MEVDVRAHHLDDEGDGRRMGHQREQRLLPQQPRAQVELVVLGPALHHRLVQERMGHPVDRLEGPLDRLGIEGLADHEEAIRIHGAPLLVLESHELHGRCSGTLGVQSAR
jgi:hypothetical protein